MDIQVFGWGPKALEECRDQLVMSDMSAKAEGCTMA